MLGAVLRRSHGREVKQGILSQDCMFVNEEKGLNFSRAHLTQDFRLLILLYTAATVLRKARSRIVGLRLSDSILRGNTTSPPCEVGSWQLPVLQEGSLAPLKAARLCDPANLSSPAGPS